MHMSNRNMRTRCGIGTLAKRKPCVREIEIHSKFLTWRWVICVSYMYIHGSFRKLGYYPRWELLWRKMEDTSQFLFDAHAYFQSPSRKLSLSVSVSLSLSFLLCNSNTWSRCYDNKIDTAFPIRGKLRCGKVGI